MTTFDLYCTTIISYRTLRQCSGYLPYVVHGVDFQGYKGICDVLAYNSQVLLADIFIFVHSLFILMAKRLFAHYKKKTTYTRKQSD